MKQGRGGGCLGCNAFKDSLLNAYSKGLYKLRERHHLGLAKSVQQDLTDCVLEIKIWDVLIKKKLFTNIAVLTSYIKPGLQKLVNRLAQACKELRFPFSLHKNISPQGTDTSTDIIISRLWK
ncbi:hypothetical protein ElyMa_000108400 [Elysia marginata]|uniref:Uncharacterized protein n=1 Tax=Elysia marginata TaxID=1093978 RepID=A0AAV4ELH0_9GAST|nr:hypothetical protein ElyMa_000108400 [Elysia marginata]